jgi:hypothetical protein
MAPIATAAINEKYSKIKKTAINFSSKLNCVDYLRLSAKATPIKNIMNTKMIKAHIILTSLKSVPSCRY